MNKLEAIFRNTPAIYSKIDSNSDFYGVMSAFAREFSIAEANITRVRDMFGVSYTWDDDLEYRWGSFLSIPKEDYETYDEYRARLSMQINTMVGGTIDSLKFAISMGITNVTGLKPSIQDIEVYDGWDPAAIVDIDDERKQELEDANAHDYAHAIIVFNFNFDTTIYNEDIIKNIVNTYGNMSKAAGVKIHFLTKNTFFTHKYLSNFTHEKLASFTHYQLNSAGFVIV
jgi:hypothetical protein